jgi:hypothetical protein
VRPNDLFSIFPGTDSLEITDRSVGNKLTNGVIIAVVLIKSRLFISKEY